MKRKINILHPEERHIFQQQISLQIEKKFEVYENSKKDVIWDLVIVFEKIKTPKKIRYRKGNLWFVSGEPELASYYCAKFLDQFDKVYCVHKYIKHKALMKFQHFNDWHYSFNRKTNKNTLSFQEIFNMQPPEKSKNFSVINSNLKQLPFHRKRLQIIDEIKSKTKNKIDFYGRGIKSIDEKRSALDQYRFHICFENNQTMDLWTEKIADPILSYCIPIYIGCRNIKSYFSNDSIIQIDPTNLDSIIALINMENEELYNLYHSRLPNLIRDRQKLMEEFTIFGELNKIDIKYGSEIENKYIKPNETFKSWYFANLLMRVKRKLISIVNISF